MKREIKIKAEKKPEVVALGVTRLFRIVVTENGAKREYIVDYKTDSRGHKSLLCVADGRVVFADESFCGAPIADYEQIKECLAEQLEVPTEKLLD
jgi:hypothetical protein